MTGLGTLRWQVMRAALPHVQQWGAVDGLATFIITRDAGCRPDDSFYNRFAVSAKLAGGKRLDLGVHDTLQAAKDKAEATRSPQRKIP
jgi:hypothetical protein